MKYSNVHNLRYANPEGTLVTADVFFSHIGEVVPFTASPGDSERHGREIFAKAKAGEYGAVAPYIAPVSKPAKPVTLSAEKLASILVSKGILTADDLIKGSI